MFAALKNVISSLPTPPSLPSFNFSLFKPEADLPYIQESIIDNFSVDKKDILEKLLDNLSIEYFPTFILFAGQTTWFGKLASPIHIFNTFEFFLSTAERIEKTKKIYHKTGPQPKFEHFKSQSIKGFARFLEKRHDKGELLPYLDDFCEKTKKDKTLLETLVNHPSLKERA